MKIERCIRRDLDNNNHSVFSLNYHLILVVKNRRKVITGFICEYLKHIFYTIEGNYKIDLLDMDHEPDYVHILFKAEPDSELSKFINAYKSASSRRVKNDFPEIKEELQGGAFWSKSYCLITSDGASIDILKQYVEAQGGRE